jgi:drug/metabolite transporter (DMT)-like permease
MGESLTKALGFSLLFCTTGLVICQYHELSIATGGQEFIGLILVLLAAICEALFVILRKKVNSIAVDPFTANTYLCYIGAALFLPFALWDLRSFSFSGVSAKAYVPLIYSALFVNIAAFTLWFRGCDKVSSVTSGVFIGVMPVSALILSYIFLHEPINLSMVIGIALVITGLLIIIVPIGNSKPGLKP